MADNIDRKKRKLYQQWVENSGLPPDKVPDNPDQSEDTGETAEFTREKRRWDIGSGLTLHLTMRHLLYLMLIIIVLLIATASLATILIMRSC